MKTLKITPKMLEKKQRLAMLRRQISLTDEYELTQDGLFICYVINGKVKEIDCDFDKGLHWLELSTVDNIRLQADGYVYDMVNERSYYKTEFLEHYTLTAYDAIDIVAHYEFLLED
jgi:hypothetical protein